MKRTVTVCNLLFEGINLAKCTTSRKSIAHTIGKKKPDKRSQVEYALGKTRSRRSRPYMIVLQKRPATAHRTLGKLAAFMRACSKWACTLMHNVWKKVLLSQLYCENNVVFAATLNNLLSSRPRTKPATQQ